MKNAIRVGRKVINTDHILSVYDAVDDVVSVAYCDGGLDDFDAGTPEADALRWWFCDADRVVLANPYRTIDIVRLHEDAIALAAFPRIPGLDRITAPSRLHIGPARPCCRQDPDLFVPPVAEAVCDAPKGVA